MKKKVTPPTKTKNYILEPAVLCKAVKTCFPMPYKEPKVKLSNEEKIDFIADRFKEIMEVLGLDLSDESIARTPYRVGKMYVNEIFSGLDMNNFPTISLIEDRYQHGENTNIVFVKVRFTSFCEHHFLPMFGTAYVAYRPNGKLIGLSKIPRIVKFYSKRPQVQERLTAQIADCLATILHTKDVAVSIAAQHFCVIARGVEDENSEVITNVLKGDFEKDKTLQNEFFDSIRRTN